MLRSSHLFAVLVPLAALAACNDNTSNFVSARHQLRRRAVRQRHRRADHGHRQRRDRHDQREHRVRPPVRVSDHRLLDADTADLHQRTDDGRHSGICVAAVHRRQLHDRRVLRANGPIQFATLSNAFAPISGDAGLRLFNAASTSGTLVINGNGVPLTTGVKFGVSSGFFNVAPPRSRSHSRTARPRCSTPARSRSPRRRLDDRRRQPGSGHDGPSLLHDAELLSRAHRLSSSSSSACRALAPSFKYAHSPIALGTSRARRTMICPRDETRDRRVRVPVRSRSSNHRLVVEESQRCFVSRTCSSSFFRSPLSPAAPIKTGFRHRRSHRERAFRERDRSADLGRQPRRCRVRQQRPRIRRLGGLSHRGCLERNALTFTNTSTSAIITGSRRRFRRRERDGRAFTDANGNTQFATLNNTFTPTSGQSGLRVFNAANGSGTLSIMGNGTALGVSVPFGTASDFVSVPWEWKTLTFTNGSASCSMPATWRSCQD